jgi:hydrogenase maturation factor HypF (carbamoyltransferase family)
LNRTTGGFLLHCDARQEKAFPDLRFRLFHPGQAAQNVSAEASFS